jgi:hypothetical protein
LGLSKKNPTQLCFRAKSVQVWISNHILKTSQWAYGSQVETLKCQFRSGGDMKMLITLKWRHEHANYAQLETW